MDPFAPSRFAGASTGNAAAAPRLESTPVSYQFFGRENVEAVQQAIRFRVHSRTGRVIDRQGDAQLGAIMSSVYGDSQAPTLEGAVRGAKASAVVRQLNERVLDRAVREVVKGLQMHDHYLTSISTPVSLPLPRGQFADQRKGTKTLELPVGF